MTKKLIIIFTLSLILLGCSNEKIKEEKYTSDGLTITMESGLIEKELLDATIYYEGTKMFMTGLKKTFTNSTDNLSSSSSTKDYAKEIINNIKADYSIKEDGNLVYFTYKKDINDKKFYYFSSILKGDDAFWVITFACQNSSLDEYYPYFVSWAKSIVLE